MASGRGMLERLRLLWEFVAGDGRGFRRAGDPQEGTILGAGGGSRAVDILRISFPAFIHCLPCCIPDRGHKPADVRAQEPMYTVPLCTGQLPQHTGAMCQSAALSGVGRGPGWARLEWLCRAELLGRMRTNRAADRCPWAGISHSDGQQRAISFPPRHHPAEQSSEEPKSTSRLAKDLDGTPAWAQEETHSPASPAPVLR